MNVACPECRTVYRVDPSRVPGGGVSVRCRECDSTFRVDGDATRSPGEVTTATAVPAGGSAPAAPSTEAATEAANGPSSDTQTGPSTETSTEAATRHAVPESAPADTGRAGQGPSTPAGAPKEAGHAGPAAASSPAAGRRPATAPAFGPQDPQTRARRLARALVSDIKVYNPEKWEQSRAAGTLRSEFREEVLKSWQEYVEQVGEEMARKTPYFRDALNDILAGGTRVF